MKRGKKRKGRSLKRPPGPVTTLTGWREPILQNRVILSASGLYARGLLTPGKGAT